MGMPVNKTAVWGIIFSLLLAVPSGLGAREKPDARLRIEKSDGTLVEGDLLKVAGDTLFLYNQRSRQGSQVTLGEVRQLGVRHRTDIAGKMIIGILAGAGAGLAAGTLLSSRSDEKWFSAYLISELLCIPVGALLMASTSGSRRNFENRQVEDLPEVKMMALLNELKGMSREMRNYHQDVMK